MRRRWSALFGGFVENKERLLKDLLKLGVCYRARLTENDLGVYAEMIDARMDDTEWAATMAHYSGDLGPVDQQFMPTPLELIAVGKSFVAEKRRREDERRENHQRYLERQERLRVGDELLHNGECPK